MKVSWDDDIPNIWKVIKAMFQTTTQDKFPLNSHPGMVKFKFPDGTSLVSSTEISAASAMRHPSIQRWPWTPSV
jgi:hypothetical protein